MPGVSGLPGVVLDRARVRVVFETCNFGLCPAHAWTIACVCIARTRPMPNTIVEQTPQTKSERHKGSGKGDVEAHNAGAGNVDADSTETMTEPMPSGNML